MAIPASWPIPCSSSRRCSASPSGGGPFLGVNELTYHQPVYPSDSLRAESVVLDRRVSDSHKGFGIVSWHSKGFNQREELVIDFKRTNLVRLRNPQ